MTPQELISFEDEVKVAFEAGKIRGPVHLAGGNEEQLIEIFALIKPTDWVFATYRSHYHALLHGVPREKVMEQIMAGRSMNLSFPEHKFVTSAIVGGCLSMAVGVAEGLKRGCSLENVLCFVGDMAATLGVFYEARNYAKGHNLPIMFVVEDNGMSCDSPTKACWGVSAIDNTLQYEYTRKHPHVGTGKYVQF